MPVVTFDLGTQSHPSVAIFLAGPWRLACLLMLRFSGMNCPSSTTSLKFPETWMDPTHPSTSSLSLSLREMAYALPRLGIHSTHFPDTLTAWHSADVAPRADLTSWGPGEINAAPEPPTSDTVRGQARSLLSLSHQFLVFPKGLWENKDLCPNVRRMRRKKASQPAKECGCCGSISSRRPTMPPSAAQLAVLSL